MMRHTGRVSSLHGVDVQAISRSRPGRADAAHGRGQGPSALALWRVQVERGSRTVDVDAVWESALEEHKYWNLVTILFR